MTSHCNSYSTAAINIETTPQNRVTASSKGEHGQSTLETSCQNVDEGTINGVFGPGVMRFKTRKGVCRWGWGREGVQEREGGGGYSLETAWRPLPHQDSRTPVPFSVEIEQDH